MEQIGYFDKLIFSVNNKKVYTFTGLKKTNSSRWSNLVVRNKKPISVFEGEELQSISFSIVLDVSIGINPLDEIKKWNEYVESGRAGSLVIGTKPIGKNKWVIESISESWNTVTNKGKLTSASIDISLKEYVE